MTAPGILRPCPGPYGKCLPSTRFTVVPGVGRKQTETEAWVPTWLLFHCVTLGKSTAGSEKGTHPSEGLWGPFQSQPHRPYDSHPASFRVNQNQPPGLVVPQLALMLISLFGWSTQNTPKLSQSWPSYLYPMWLARKKIMKHLFHQIPAGVTTSLHFKLEL